MDNIKEFFGGSLEVEGARKMFEYSKRGKRYILQKVDIIASRWEKALAVDLVLAARWQLWLDERNSVRSGPC